MKNWTISIEEIEENKILKYKIIHKDESISFSSFIDHLKTSVQFRFFFSQLLAQSKFSAYFWEVKPICYDDTNQQFEFVIINSKSLTNIKSNKSSFENYLQTQKEVVSFKNLRKDATLVVPTESVSKEIYGHLAAFVRNAPRNQVDEFWKMVAIEYSNLLVKKPTWLSTHCLGVHWLHIRIDSIPKYYHYHEYRIYKP